MSGPLPITLKIKENKLKTVQLLPFSLEDKTDTHLAIFCRGEAWAEPGKMNKI